MDIPTREIEEKKQLLQELEEIRYIHYRDLYTVIDGSNYQFCTKVDFKEIKPTHKNILESWGRLKHSFGSDITFEHKSKSGSEYFVTPNGDVYRLSNHWGAVATCEWTLDGNGELRMSVMVSGELQIGVANLKDFQIFRRKDDRRRDILVNPEWIEKIKVILPLAQTLHNMIHSEDFKLLSGEEKNIIGTSFGKFGGILKQNSIIIW